MILSNLIFQQIVRLPFEFLIKTICTQLKIERKMRTPLKRKREIMFRKISVQTALRRLIFRNLCLKDKNYRRISKSVWKKN